ncbi:MULTISPECIES: carbohydrate ABC transporter permease [Rhodococcus]|uniref:ABC transporter permease n=2 Tax=Rhodococcus opacus TaxID=37919 RepID=I0WIP8_RHOOP|nr:MULTISPECIES: carbohydrate ABC transporter permease [Rhodococcus]EID76264.1 ABC transporter permease [Rhodococcus opacus RKJ300 = JCM 13270]QQZ12525.1 carbohydrate ABC transporter permease [Rhodococcus sp. 21391]
MTMTTPLADHSAPVDRTGPRNTAAVANRRRLSTAHAAIYLLLTALALLWIFPLLWALYNSFRDYDYVLTHGYLSVGGFTLSNYTESWEVGGIPHYFLNSMLITIPAVLLILFIGSMAAFVLARFPWKFNVIMLAVFIAGNLLPQQTLLTPLFRLYNAIPLPYWMSSSGSLYDSYWGLILVHVAFQTGFCVFVLSNYMKTVPPELLEAATVDGAGLFRQYWQVVLPLCRPALAALATLMITWIYNDFFWALALMVSGDKLPVTTALQNLQGSFFTDTNLLAAGSVLVALPTVLVFVALQRHFVSGLTMGASK